MVEGLRLVEKKRAKQTSSLIFYGGIITEGEPLVEPLPPKVGLVLCQVPPGLTRTCRGLRISPRTGGGGGRWGFVAEGRGGGWSGRLPTCASRAKSVTSYG